MEEASNIQNWYLHVDLDAFFASVEQLDHPEYRGKPVIVGGKPEDRRGVVSTASYEARKFGVHSAMPTYQAYKLCPQGIFVHGNMQRYAEISYKIIGIFKNYSPDVQQMSIDEAFIDLTGTEKLFGKPEDTAKKIKEEVKNQTGLTVSIGLAATKYIAKIASGYSKPDGFHFVQPGKESEFMLSLPLKDIWGIGNKTIELLNKNGIKTTNDIYERDLDLLTFQFGNNLGTFLYNAVRGLEKDSFNQKSKTHSISAETTFAYDLTDKYSIETTLLDLAHGVFFRLLKENCYSKTAFVKIRYDDFSTFTVQETLSQSIKTLDSFFEILKRLFEKKYENGRGVRLLGVGFENVESTDKPVQLELFDSGEEKKQAVEKAILNLKKKHPEIQIRKARTLKALFIISLLSLFSQKQISAQEQQHTKAGGAAALLPDTISEEQNINSPSLFNLPLNDKNKVIYTLDGYWKALFEGGIAFTPENLNFSLVTPVFKQEVELSAEINLNDKYFFYTSFADEFNKNTFSFKYKNHNLEAGISNRNISFPSVYSANKLGFGLTGGNNEAPGLYLHRENATDKKYTADFMLRYESTETKNATFYGKNSVTEHSIQIYDFTAGKEFLFPEQSKQFLTEVKDIYVQSQQGTYKDSKGRLYKKIDNGDYIILPDSGKLIFSSNAKTSSYDDGIPSIIITFTNSTYVQDIITNLGNYSDINTYLGQIQKIFTESGKRKLKLSDYSYNLLTKIDNSDGLCIQNPTGFSPFCSYNLYDLGIISDADISVVNNSTDNTDLNFTAELYEDFFKGTDVFNEKKQYACISQVKQSLNIKDRYPFIDIAPEIYVGIHDTYNLEIREKTYSEIKDFNIGTDVIAGTVQVYINNALYSSAVYDPDTGTVYISRNISSSDKIYILWQTESSDSSNGNIAFGGGLFFDYSPAFSSNFSITSRWPVSLSEKYSTPDNIVSGFTALSGGIKYENTNLKLSDDAAIALKNNNGADNLLINSTSVSNETSYLNQNSGYKTKTEPSLNLKNNSIQLTDNKNCTVKNNFEGIKDPLITGYKIPLQWDFTESLQDNWASADILLSDGNLLKDSSGLEIALQPAESASSDVDIYIQLGIKAETSFSGEDTADIPTWKIDSFDMTNKNWQTVKINITDEDSAKLRTKHDARIIIVQKNNAKSSGTIYIGPYKPILKTTNISSENPFNIYSRAENTISPSSKELFITDNQSAVISWEIENSSVITEDNAVIKAKKYFKAVSINNYKKLNFDFSYIYSKQETSPVTSTNPEFKLTLLNSEKTAVEITIKDMKNYISKEFVFHSLILNLETKQLYIDDIILPDSAYSIYLNKKVIPDCIQTEFNTITNNNLITKGSFYIDNLYFSESNPEFNGINNFEFTLNKDGAIAKVKDYEIIKNGNFNFSSNQKFSTPINSEESDKDFIISAATEGNITIADVIISADFNSDYTVNSQNSVFDNAGHKIIYEKPVAGFFSFKEEYRIAESESLKKLNTATIDLSKIKIPVVYDFNVQAEDFTDSKNQKIDSKLTINIPLFKNNKITFNTETKNSQKVKTLITSENTLNKQNYFYGWYDISKFEFSNGEESAVSRNTDFNSELQLTTNKNIFNPLLSYNLSGNTRNYNDDYKSTNSKLKLKLPVTLNKTSFSLEVERNAYIKQNTVEAKNYSDDYKLIFYNQMFMPNLYNQIPVYELFNKKLKENISTQKNLINNCDVYSYNSVYSFNWQRHLLNNISDFFIPSSANTSLYRTITSTENLSDLIQLKTTLNTKAINTFGSYSNLKLINWYQTDEMLSSLTFLFKINEDTGNVTFSLADYIQLVLHINEHNNIKQGLDFYIESESDWNGNITTIWTRKSDKSLLIAAVNLFAKEKFNADKIERKEIFNFSIKDINKDIYQIYSISHNVDVNFKKYYTVSTGISAAYNSTKNAKDYLSTNITLGGKVNF